MEIGKTNNFWIELQTIIEEVSKEFDKRWQVRKRVITSHLLVLFIFKLLLSKNKQGYNSTICELWDTVSSTEGLELPQETPVAASSLCEARQKMPETIFEEMNKAILVHWQQESPFSGWHGHRVFAVDGSKINLPHELSNKGYKIQDADRRHYPTGLMSVLYNLSDGMVYDFSLESHLDERSSAIAHMDQMSAGDVMVVDRGYFSYWFLHESTEKEIHLICRLQPGNMNKAIKQFWDSDKKDVIIDYTPSVSKVSELKKRGFTLKHDKIPLRLIKYTIDNELHVCATTLLNEQYSIEEISEIYHARWGIEELYKISKQHIDVEDFHSKTEKGVKQELYAHLLLINIARIFESEAKKQIPPSVKSNEDIDIKNSYWQDFSDNLQNIKINFKNCLLVVGRYLERLFLGDSSSIKDWLPMAISFILRVKQKIRPGRHYPRHSHKPHKKWAGGHNQKLKKA